MQPAKRGVVFPSQSHPHNHHCWRWRSTQVAECRDAHCPRSGELLHARSATRVLGPRPHGAVVTLVRHLRDQTPHCTGVGFDFGALMRFDIKIAIMKNLSD